MTNKIVSIKTTNAIFLAIVLFTGTITVLSSPSSFMTIGAAQAQQYYGKDNTFGDSEKELPSVYDKNLQITKKLQELLEQYKKLVEPSVYDKNLQITQLTEELNFPTGIDFLAEDDILVIEKNTGLVKRILDGKVLNEPVLDVNVASESERGLLGIAILNTRSLTNADIITTTNNNEESQQANNVNNE
ncbi:MAG TPA: hypothetical protein VJ583_04825, partial [Nitrososphaeraceae archaeon]|nr:hypothetical protein [Nitrososphaeraceae archaeon]